jgi:rhamnose transport system ATP-binding protein
MVGRELGEFFVKDNSPQDDVILSVKGLSLEGAFSDINFEIHRGEILGFAGLVGSRRTDVALSLFGIAPADSGEVVLEGNQVNVRSPQQAIKLGIAYVPEDRREQGLVLPMNIAANISLPMLREYLNQLGIINRQQEAQTAEDYREQLSIRTPTVQLQANKLSGGNQQKVVLSKWLNTRPHLLILDEPTRGIDVGAKAEVHSIINELAKQGLGIMLISSELPEVLAMSDRILVMREGKQMGIFSQEEANPESIMTAAMGQADITAATMGN